MKSGKLASGLLVLALAAPCPVLANDPNTVSGDKGTDMLVDAVVMRPLGLVATVLGTAATVVTLPFTLAAGNAGEAAHYMIVEPAEYTFNRPLGDFDHCGEDRTPAGCRTARLTCPSCATWQPWAPPGAGSRGRCSC